MIMGVSLSKTPTPNSSWVGPVQCITINAKEANDGHQELCGRRLFGWPLLQEENVTSECHYCSIHVACIANQANLVDGTMRALPANQSTHHGKCIEEGHSFTGYYRIDPHHHESIAGMEVEPTSRIERERAVHELQQTMAPIFAGSGGLTIFAILVFLIYSTCCSLACRPEYHRLPKEGWSPSPHWRSDYAMVRGSIKQQLGCQQRDDVCRFCLSAACGEVVFNPCGHACVCLTCSGMLRECPVCSDPIEGIRIGAALLL